jgi:MtN3 and saliva related transmembrane protein
MTLEVLALIATFFGVLMGASPLLQALRAHRKKSSNDVSISFLIVLLLGGLTWLSYGIALNNWALIIGNSVGVISSSTALIFSIRWR